ncbi:hypothetical protein F5Y17DRAFT_178894 [Xylariaceae sp. FL0594]|nr:hypothetical protein F5Y17DRAFT_178894 [Xylariaceae sp. FL0594]
MKGTSALRTALLSLLQASLSTQLYIPDHGNLGAPAHYPTRTIANVTVVDTELVQKALVFGRNHSNDVVWNHVMRGWLYGTLILAHNETLRRAVDAEAHALAAILHDLGWDQTPGSTTVSADKRFEVDGAMAACDFIRNNHAPSSSSSHRPPNRDSDGDGGWDDHRLQLVWDSIALHTQPSIFPYKEDTVAVTGWGIYMDFVGPFAGVTGPEYDAVAAAYPRTLFEEGVNATFVWLCETKPSTTWDTFMQVWGDNYVANYSAKGQRVFDIIANVTR